MAHLGGLRLECSRFSHMEGLGPFAEDCPLILACMGLHIPGLLLKTLN